jgi:hypothetical protein
LTEVTNGLAKSLTFLRVSGHDFDGTPRDPHRHGGQSNPLDFQVPHHTQGRTALDTDEVLHWNNDVVEHELGGHAGAHAEFVFYLLS